MYAIGTPYARQHSYGISQRVSAHSGCCFGNGRVWWRAVRLLSGTKIADLTVWSILLFNPKDEGIFVVEADYATIESAGGKWVPADRIAFSPIPIAEEGGTGS